MIRERKELERQQREHEKLQRMLVQEEARRQREEEYQRRREERARKQVRKELKCLLQYGSEQLCKDQARAYFGDAVTAMGCSAIIQELDGGDVNGAVVFASLVSDSLSQSESFIANIGALLIDGYLIHQCINS